MRSDIVPGAVFPDYELPDHTDTMRTLSEIQGDDRRRASARPELIMFFWLLEIAWAEAPLRVDLQHARDVGGAT